MQDGLEKAGEITFKAQTMLQSNPELFRNRRWPQSMPETSQEIRDAVKKWSREARKIQIPGVVLLDFIGAGSYGICFSCINVDTPRKPMLCKIIPIMPNIKFKLADEINLQKQIAREKLAPPIYRVCNKSAANDAYCAKITQDVRDDVNINTVVIIMEKCKESLITTIKAGRYVPGSISDLLHASRKLFVHGDLKSNNICTDSSGKLVYIDFGRSYLCKGLPPKITEEGHLLDAAALLNSIKRHSNGGALEELTRYISTLDCKGILTDDTIKKRRKLNLAFVTSAMDS